MTRNFLAACLMVCIVLAIIYAGSARAQGPVAGEPFETSNGIVCDTKEQVLDLFEASKTNNGRGIIPKYLEYKAKIDKDGEPSCFIQPVLTHAVISVEDMGESKGYDGATVHAWIAEVKGSDNAIGWVLYGEAEAPPPGQEI